MNDKLREWLKEYQRLDDATKEAANNIPEYAEYYEAPREFDEYESLLQERTVMGHRIIQELLVLEGIKEPWIRKE